MYPHKVDIPVYMIFFNRPDTFRKVFDAVKQARPSKLFLACDGVRANREDDLKNITLCKQIAEDIDWECEVHKNYSEENLGCGMRMYSGINWAFEYVDRLIILEDDCVPSQEFFPFCAEVLEKYKDDDRVFMINAMNHLGEYRASDSSYFFGQGCCWGWATWKRAWRNVDFQLNFMNDTYYMQCVEKKFPYYCNAIQWGNELKAKIAGGKKQSTWTFQAGMSAALQSQLAIVPSVNMITNVGLTVDSGHAVNDKRKLARRAQQYFDAPMYKMEFPLVHPKYMVEDLMYYEKVQRRFKPTLLSKIEGCVRKVLYAERGEITAALKRKFLR